MVTKVITCLHCGSDDIVKNGFAPNGKQKYLCHACTRQSREDPSPNGYTKENAKRRSLAPTRSDPLSGGFLAPSAFRPPRYSQLAQKKVAALKLEDTLLETPDGEVLELDVSYWSFVYRKSEKVCGSLVGLVPGDSPSRRGFRHRRPESGNL